jgi:hypothetical protein
MSKEEARALCETVERTPGGWMTESFQGANGCWYLVAGRTSDPLTHFMLRSLRDWEQLCELLTDDGD